jgi:hypothetical protein
MLEEVEEEEEVEHNVNGRDIPGYDSDATTEGESEDEANKVDIVEGIYITAKFTVKY